MREIYRMIPELAKNRERAAYCTVVDTVGSTPQKAGAKLLILPTFQNVGTLGGGCVEAEARNQAMRLMQEGDPRLLEFRLNDDYGWDDGLICGGSMKVFIDLTNRPEDAPLFAETVRLLDADVPVVLSTVVQTDGSDPAVRPGNKLMMGVDGTRRGTLGNASLDRELLPVAIKAVERHSPQFWEGPHHAVFVEALLPQIRLVIAGAGHVGKAVAHFAAMCDFKVIVVDDRKQFANEQNIPDAHELIVGDMPTVLRDTPIDPMTFVVIVTRGHHHDEECLHAVIESSAGYIGLIGSRRKIKLIFDDLRDLGVSDDRLDRVYAPIGLDIASQTVPEIAVSIVAQLIQIRNTRKIAGFAEALASANP